MESYNKGLENAKCEYLNGDIEGYPEEVWQYFSSLKDFFTNDFINYLIDKGKNFFKRK